MEVEYAASDKIKKLPASYQRAMRRAKYANMSTEELKAKRAQLEAQILAMRKAKPGDQKKNARRPPAAARTLQDKCPERMAISENTRYGKFLRESDTNIAKSYFHALFDS